jgi:hypothetical protein
MAIRRVNLIRCSADGQTPSLIVILSSLNPGRSRRGPNERSGIRDKRRSPMDCRIIYIKTGACAPFAGHDDFLAANHWSAAAFNKDRPGKMF